MGEPVVFEGVSYSRPGCFSIPRPVMEQLGLRNNVAVELVIDGGSFQWKGVTDVRSGGEIYFRKRDKTTAGLDKLLPKTPIKVQIRRLG